MIATLRNNILGIPRKTRSTRAIDSPPYIGSTVAMAMAGNPGPGCLIRAWPLHGAADEQDAAGRDRETSDPHQDQVGLAEGAHGVGGDQHDDQDEGTKSRQQQDDADEDHQRGHEHVAWRRDVPRMAHGAGSPRARLRRSAWRMRKMPMMVGMRQMPHRIRTIWK